MSNIAAIAITALSIVVGGYGLYRVAYAQGYVCGYEEGTHPTDTVFTED